MGSRVPALALLSLGLLSAVAFATAAPAPAGAGARPAAAQATLEPLGRFRRPTYLTAPRGDLRRQFVVEARGVIRVVLDGRRLRRPFLDIRRRVRCCNEAGLLSMAFAPDYGLSRRFYVYYTDRTGSIVVEEFLRSAGSEDVALPSSRRRLLRQVHRTENHKGGQLQFGPDGMLYLGLGDGGPANDPHRRGQDLRTLLGKILRIDPRPGRRPYRVPADNPFARRRGVRPEIWAYGVRNPWRFSFTPQGGFAMADVGQDRVEEIDYVAGREGRPPPGGYNFGWSIFEGTRRFRPGRAPGHVRPVLQHPRRSGLCSIIGGYVVRDPELPALRGRYVYGDFCSTRLRVVRLRPGRARGDRALGPRVTATSSFGEDGRGRLYVMSVTGAVFRLAPPR